MTMMSSAGDPFTKGDDEHPTNEGLSLHDEKNSFLETNTGTIAPLVTTAHKTTGQEATPRKRTGRGKGRKVGAGTWSEAETDLAFNIIEELLPTGDEGWEEVAVEFYNTGKDRGYNRTGSAIKSHFHKLAFASAPTGRTVPPRLIERARNIKKDIDKEEVIGYANLNDVTITLSEVTTADRSGLTGTNLVDNNGEVRRPQAKKHKTAEVAAAIKELGQQNFKAANAVSESVALMASKFDDSADQEQRLSNIEGKVGQIEGKVDQILSLISAKK